MKVELVCFRSALPRAAHPRGAMTGALDEGRPESWPNRCAMTDTFACKYFHARRRRAATIAQVARPRRSVLKYRRPPQP